MRSIAAYGLGPAIGLITAPILAQSLGVEGRGQLAAVMQPLTVADSFAAIGLPTAVVYFIARGGSAERVQKYAFQAVALTAVAAYVGLALYSGPVSDSQSIPQWLLLLIWSSVIPGAILAVRRANWAGHRQWKLMDAERTSFALARLVAIVILAVLGSTSVGWFAGAPIISGLVISTLLLWRRIPPGVEVSDSETTRRRSFYKFSALSALGTVSSTASARLDQAIFPSVGTSEQLGLYAVARTIAEIPLVVGVVLGRNLMSDASAQESGRKMIKVAGAGLGITILGCLAIAGTAWWLVPLFFGVGFEGSLLPLYILLGCTVLSVISAGVGAIITGWGKPLLSSVPQVASMVAVVIMFVVAGPGVDAVTAAWIATASQLIAAIFAVVLMWRLAIARKRPGAVPPQSTLVD